MADSKPIDILLGTIGDPNGRKAWLDYKLTQSDAVDLGGMDVSNKDLRDYDFSEVDLSQANFFGADVTGADFSDAVLVGADFRRALMNNCVLDRADLSGALMQGAMLSDSCLDEANLSNARLQGADLIGADLGSADLTNCDLRSACLKYTRLQGATLQGANVAEADLTGSVLDDDAPYLLRNFDLAIIDDRKYRVMKGATKPKPVEAEESKEATQPPPPKRPAPAAPPPPPEPDAGKTKSGDDSLFDLKVEMNAAMQAEAVSAFNGSDSAANLFGGAAAKAEPVTAPPPPPPRQAETPKAEQAQPKPKPEPAEKEESFSGSGSGKYQAPKFGKPEPGPARPEPKKEEPKTEESSRGFFSFRRPKSKADEERDLEAERKARISPSNPLGVEYVAADKDLDSDEGCARILGVKLTANVTEVTKAFRGKAKLFHPDKVRHMDERTQTFARDQFEFCRRAHDILKRRGGGGMGNVVWVEGVPKRNSPYDHTLDELIKLVRVNPKHEILVYNLAWKYYEAGKLDKAIEHFERVILINPDNEDAAHNLKSAKLQKVFQPR